MSLLFKLACCVIFFTTTTTTLESLQLTFFNDECFTQLDMKTVRCNKIFLIRNKKSDHIKSFALNSTVFCKIKKAKEKSRTRIPNH
jgi:hypothetical protein